MTETPSHLPANGVWITYIFADRNEGSNETVRVCGPVVAWSLNPGEAEDQWSAVVPHDVASAAKKLFSTHDHIMTTYSDQPMGG